MKETTSLSMFMWKSRDPLIKFVLYDLIILENEIKYKDRGS